jgi:hypothetical protein
LRREASPALSFSSAIKKEICNPESLFTGEGTQIFIFFAKESDSLGWGKPWVLREPLDDGHE